MSEVMALALRHAAGEAPRAAGGAPHGRRSRTLTLGLGCVVLASACSGDAFRLTDVVASGGSVGSNPSDADAGGAGGSGFPPLMPNTSRDPEASIEGDADAATDSGAAAPVPVPEVAACGEARAPDALLRNAEVCIAPGTFTMGSVSGNVPAGYVSHGPAHSVTLSAYFLDAYEVTVARYRLCVEAGACEAPSADLTQGCTYAELASDRERHPVTCVSWQDAQSFCQWDGGRRLPTEAEWERAAVGPEGFVYPWGDDFGCTRAVVASTSQCSEHAGSAPKEVGSLAFGQSAEHAFDLTGNAWEWVADWFGPYNALSVTDPTGPGGGNSRIWRGGNWQSPPASAFSYLRRAEAPAVIAPTSFRCARSGS
jgi:formylglycine-generating enzyme required for sulfatase activity